MRCRVIAWPMRPVPTTPIFSWFAICALAPWFGRHVRLMHGTAKAVTQAATQKREGDMQDNKLIARAALIAGALGIALMASSAALSQSGYPNRPIRILVGFAPGG